MPAPFLPVVQSPDQLPPGGGGLVVKHQETFNSVYMDPARTYRSPHDEAQINNPENAIGMRFDPTIMEPLETRYRATALLTWHIEPDDAADPAQVAAAANVDKRLRRTPWLQDLYTWLLEATWFGRSAVQVMYRYEVVDGKMGVSPYDHIPINGDKLAFGYRDKAGAPGRLGVKVSAAYSTDGGWEATQDGPVHFFTDHERQSLVVHKYRPEDIDFRRPWKAGAVEGMGLRERVYWFWSAKQITFGYLSDYLRWFAKGLTVYYYPASNPTARAEAIAQAENGEGKSYLIWPRWENGGNAWKPFDRLDPSTASTQLLESLITNYFDGVIRRMILGTSGTTLGGPTGLGSDTASVLERTGDAVIKYDANGLQDALNKDFVPVVYAWNHPGMPPGRLVFEIDAPNVEQLIKAIELYTSLGGEVGAESTRKLLGLPAPKPGEAILGQLQANQPAAVDGVPQGVPVVQGAAQPAGQPAPDPGPDVPTQ